MNSPMLQLLVLAGIAIFLILKLRNVLGSRDGFELPPQERQTQRNELNAARRDYEDIDNGSDRDIIDHVPENSTEAKALAAMKSLDKNFTVGGFLQGARGAYEMILMGFERGDLAEIKPFLSEDVYETFADVISAREEQGLTVEAEFFGVRETKLEDATFDPETNTAEISVRFIGELASVVRDNSGEIVEGKPNAPKKQKDVWTFSRVMGSDDPNWELVATGG